MNKLILSIFTIALYTTSIDGQTRFLYENDLCKSGDSRWVCKKLEDCPSGQKGLRKGVRPEICTFIGLEPVVCCDPDQNEPVETPAVQTLTNQQQQTPTGSNSVSKSKENEPARPAVQMLTSQQQQTPTGSNRVSKSKEKCREYARYVFREEPPPLLIPLTNPKPVKFDECASSHETLIVGGTNAKPKEFPHMAQIGYGVSGSVAWLCGGSLISERYVLSAAHCTNPGGNRGPARWARLGDLNTGTDRDEAKPVIMAIVERIDHPGYNGVQLYNDIALYKLENDVQLNPYLRPLCLDLEEIQTQTAIATGWGHTEWGGHGSEALKKVSLKRVSVESCNNTYARNIGTQLPKGILSTSQMCAGDKNGKDTCQGDSGGPLQITTRDPYCMYIQIGITSFGKACGSNNPGVYTKVSYFVPWIESIVWP